MAKPPFDFSQMLRTVQHYLSNMVIVGIIKLALRLPYEQRIRLVGWLVEKLIGPLAGYRKRALDNLRHIWPELEDADHARIADACLNNVGRTFIENYSSADFPQRQAGSELSGPGVADLAAALEDDRPVILVTGHFGNYEAVRAALVAQGLNVGGLYRNMKNPYFNAHYVKTMEGFGGPVFAQGRQGTAGFVRHLKQGGQLVLLYDQHVFGAPILDFLGQPARTAISAAELALRYRAVLIPFFGIRQENGFDFKCVLEAPVEPSDPETMTQELNDRLAARVLQHPEQWFWVHRRWRPEDAGRKQSL